MSPEPESLAVASLVIGLILGAARLASMILTRHATELDSDLSVPKALADGSDRFRALEDEVDNVKRSVESLEQRVDAGFSRLTDVVEKHSGREEDLGDRLEHLVGELIAVRQRREEEPDDSPT